MQTRLAMCSNVLKNIINNINPFMPSGLSHPSKFDQFISKIWDVQYIYFYIQNISNRNSFKQTAQTQMRRRIMRRLIWVYAVCQCLFLDARHKWVKDQYISTSSFVCSSCFFYVPYTTNPIVKVHTLNHSSDMSSSEAKAVYVINLKNKYL